MAAEVIAIGQIWFSNQALNASLAALTETGYFTVPNALVEPSLTDVGAALWGGIFFTLSIGAGVTLLSFAITFYWVISLEKVAQSEKKTTNAAENFKEKAPPTASGRKPIMMPVTIGIIWLLIIFKLNQAGISIFESLYFVAIPLVVSPLTYRWAVRRKPHNSIKIISCSLTPIVLLTVIWWTQWDENLFVRIRDHLLLETRGGRAVNDFYYRYTLYPAEVFKSLSQKMLKSVYIADLNGRRPAPEIEKRLRDHDYLVVNTADAADLTLTINGPIMIFQAKGSSPLSLPVKQFLNSPRKTLEHFSQHSDTKVFFRIIVFYSLLLGFPIILYVFVFDVSQWILSIFVSFETANLATALFCFLVGLTLFWPIWQSVPPDSVLGSPQSALSSKNWQTRVAALQTIDRQNLRTLDHVPYENSMESDHISERYWLARALAGGRTAKTYRDLLQLLHDPHPNVQCQAFYGLGSRKQRSALRPIYNAIKSSNHWYTQWYGYKALRSLEWVQPKSAQKHF